MLAHLHHHVIDVSILNHDQHWRGELWAQAREHQSSVKNSTYTRYSHVSRMSFPGQIAALLSQRSSSNFFVESRFGSHPPGSHPHSTIAINARSKTKICRVSRRHRIIHGARRFSLTAKQWAVSSLTPTATSPPSRSMPMTCGRYL